MFDICNKLMKPLTSTQKDNVLSLLKTSTSYWKIAAQTGVSKSKATVLAKEAYPDKENLPAGRPKKLSSVDEHAIIKQITTGKAENAAQVARNINPTLFQPVSLQTIRNTLHKASVASRKKQKKPKLTTWHKKACLHSPGSWLSCQLKCLQKYPILI